MPDFFLALFDRPMRIEGTVNCIVSCGGRLPRAARNVTNSQYHSLTGRAPAMCLGLDIATKPMNQLTTVLDRIAAAGPQAGEHLLPLVYDELRKLAASRMAREWDTSTLQPTALVHEAWLRLAGSEQTWKNQGHFFAAAAEAMRRILIDQARRKHALKRHAGTHRVDLDKVDVAIQADEESLLAIDEAMQKLEAQDAQCAQLVKLRFFVGMGYEEAAQALGISERSAKRYWTFARAWLYRELRGRADGSRTA